MTKKVFIILILLGLAIRLLFASLPGFKFDMDAWFSWALRLNEIGFSNFYSDQIWTNYTPGFLYILAFLGFIKNLFSIDDSILYALIKIPSILSEVLIGVFAYKFISKYSLKWALISAIFIFLNPAFIFNSSIWGQIDGFLSLFMLLSIYFLISKKLYSSSIFLGLAFLIKPQAIALFPVFGLYLIRNFSVGNILQIITPFLSIIFVFSIPFFTTNFLGLLQLFSKMISDYSYTSLFAYNFWGIIGFWVSDLTIWGMLSYQQIGFLMLLLYWLLVGFLYLKGRLSLYSAATLGLLAFYFLPTRVHERYLYPSLIFLIISSAILKSKILSYLTFILSFVHFLNLYYVYVYYNEFFLKMPKLLYNPYLYNFLEENAKLLSVFSVSIFIVISYVLIKSDYEKTKS